MQLYKHNNFAYILRFPQCTRYIRLRGRGGVLNYSELRTKCQVCYYCIVGNGKSNSLQAQINVISNLCIIQRNMKCWPNNINIKYKLENIYLRSFIRKRSQKKVPCIPTYKYTILYIVCTMYTRFKSG